MSELVLQISEEMAARLAATSQAQSSSPELVALEAQERGLGAIEMPMEPGKSFLEITREVGVVGCIDSGVSDLATKRETLRDAMVELGALGCMDSGVTDLATNPKHMEGFGQWRR